MIGVSSLCAIALMVGAFSVIFALLDPLVGDFVSGGSGNSSPPTQAVAQLAVTPPAGAGQAPAPTATVAPVVEPTATVPPEDEPTAVPATVAATPPPADAFAPDYRVTSSSRINFRQGPGVQNAVVTTLAPGTEVQYLDESQATQNPSADRLAATGQWLKFRLEDGQEGWIRDVDVAPLDG